MFRPRLLRDYPPATLDAIRSSVAALLRHQDILPTDLYVKLCLFREDLTTAINSSPPPLPRSPRTQPPPGSPRSNACDPLPDDIPRRKARPLMTQHSCACGYQADSTEDLTDHLGEMFIPPDDIAPDSQAHAEAARAQAVTGPLTCHCGHTAAIAEFDQHLIGAFTPANKIGQDGTRHAPA